MDYNIYKTVKVTSTPLW